MRRNWGQISLDKGTPVDLYMVLSVDDGMPRSVVYLPRHQFSAAQPQERETTKWNPLGSLCCLFLVAKIPKKSGGFPIGVSSVVKSWGQKWLWVKTNGTILR